MSIDNLASNLQNLHQTNKDLKSISSVLKEMANIVKIDNYRSVLSLNSWNSIENVSCIAHKLLCTKYFMNEELMFLADYFRFLRNACGGGIHQNQQFIISSNEILECMKETMYYFKDKTSEKEVVVLKCCIQLLGNLVCSNHDAKVLVWNYFLEQKVFQCLFNHKDSTVKEYTMMVLFNCMSDETARFLITSRDGHQILTLLLDGLCNDLVDWGILFLEFILKQDIFFQNCYQMLPIQSRLLILDIIIEQLSSGSENAYFFVPNSSIHYIKDIFIEYAMNIVQLCNAETSDLKPIEIVRLLNVLCDASVLDAYSSELKSSRQLLETSLDTLRSVHLLGKRNSNAFSCISSLKTMTKNDKEAIECNPSYGFKKNLIRLTGNLCFNCKDNQDTVRELDGIPLLLDCCNLDARNPFIMQWGILAIRNIMEKNCANQAVLASISVTGDLVNSALIKEMGFEIHNENGRYMLRSVQL